MDYPYIPLDVLYPNTSTTSNDEQNAILLQYYERAHEREVARQQRRRMSRMQLGARGRIRVRRNAPLVQGLGPTDGVQDSQNA